MEKFERKYLTYEHPIQGIQGIIEYQELLALCPDLATVERQLNYLKCFVMMPL